MKRKQKSSPGRLKSAFRKAAIGGLAVLFLAAAVEYSGYDVPELPDGNNILCEIDPTCRYLTEGEIEMARSVFGDRIDYDDVKVFDRPWFGVPFDFELKLVKPAIAAAPEDKSGFRIWPGIVFKTVTLERHNSGMAPNGSIYWDDKNYEEDFSRESMEKKQSFMHEMTHVFQTQSGQNIIWRAARDGLTHNYSELYDYDLGKVTDFSALHIEQQGDFIEDYYRLVTRYEESPTAAEKEKLAIYMTVLAPHFPAVKKKQEALGIAPVSLPGKSGGSPAAPSGPAPGA